MDNRTRTTDNRKQNTEHGLFKACELVNEPKSARVLNVAQIFAAIEKVRSKCANKMLYSTSYNEWVTEHRTQTTENGIQNTEYKTRLKKIFKNKWEEE